MKYIVKKSGTLMDTILELYHGVSKQKAKQMISNYVFMKNGHALANHPKELLVKDDVLEVFTTEKKIKRVKIPKRSQPFAIYFEDEHLIVGLKPAGILSTGDYNHPNEKSYHKELELFVSQRDEEKTRLMVVHRLDRELEGLMIFAKSETMQELMSKNWEEATVKGLALTGSKPDKDSGIIENWIRESNNRKIITFPTEVPDAHHAKTSYNYLQAEGKYHMIEVMVLAGRNKQIRVQLSELGCPIIGDRKYGDNSSSVKRQVRLAMTQMEFIHPLSGRTVSLSYQPPQSFFHPAENASEHYKIM